MTRDPDAEEDFGGLTPDAFDFVFSNELKRALRSQNFLTLVLIEAKPTDPAANVDPQVALRQVARLISREVRETDLLAERDKGSSPWCCSMRTCRTRCTWSIGCLPGSATTSSRFLSR